MEGICKISVSDESLACMLRAVLTLGGVKCADDGRILITDVLPMRYTDISRVILISDGEIPDAFPVQITVLRTPICFEEVIEAAMVRGEESERALESDTAEDGITVGEGCVTYRGSVISLTEQEFRLFEYLYARNGKVVGRGELRSALWSDAAEGTNVADVYISYLRRKLKPVFGEGVLLTVRGQGYVLMMPQMT